MQYRAIKYRLYPTKEQANQFDRTFAYCREVWNLMLTDWRSSYKETGVTTFTGPSQYKSQYPHLTKVDAIALANEWTNLRSAYMAFFAKRSRYPRFKSVNNCKNSYTTFECKGHHIVIVDRHHIHLPKIGGNIKAKIHRFPKENWKIRNVTVSKDPDGKYYAAMLFAYDENVKKINPDKTKVIGLDYKSNGLYMDSNGNIGTDKKFLKNSQKKITRATRNLKRKQFKSNNYEKQRKKLAKLYKRTANQRNDNLHKISAHLADEYDVICVETLDLRSVVSFHKLGKATSENGFGSFRFFISYKLNDRGKYFIKIPEYYPSTQLCSCCGNKQHIDVKTRIYTCSNCGMVMDRDKNAAINIKTKGIDVLISNGVIFK